MQALQQLIMPLNRLSAIKEHFRLSVKEVLCSN